MLAKFLATAALTAIAALLPQQSQAKVNQSAEYYLVSKGWLVALLKNNDEPTKSSCFMRTSNAKDTAQMARTWDLADLYITANIFDDKPVYTPAFIFNYPNPTNSIMVRAGENQTPAMTLYFDDRVKKFTATSDIRVEGNFNRSEGATLAYYVLDDSINEWFLRRLRKQVSSYVVSFNDQYGASMSKFHVTGAGEAFKALDECVANLPNVYNGKD